MPRLTFTPCQLAALWGTALLAVACSSAADGEPLFRDTPPRLQPSNAPESGLEGAPPAPSPTFAPDDAVPEPVAPATCSSTRAEAETIREPVDIIVVLDNSASMLDEARAVENNLNVNLASVLQESGIDYRVILLSEHRDSIDLLPSTSACIESPLSGVAQCPAPEPAFGERFFHYSIEVGSHDSLSLLLDTYSGTRRDDFGLAPGGWSSWVRSGAKKVFLEITDDDARTTSDEFLSALTARAPGHFGSDPTRPRLVWHSIVGLAEKADQTDPYLPNEGIESQVCSGNLNTVFSPGTTYQELSRLTGGLRFPICQFNAYDAVFRRIAEDVVSSDGIACGFPIPTPPSGQSVELDKVAVSYTPGDGAPPIILGQVTSASGCGPDAFFAEGGSINLCPEACAAIRGDDRAALDVLFTCESTVIVR